MPEEGSHLGNPMLDGVEPAPHGRLFGCIPIRCLPLRAQQVVLADKLLFETVCGVVMGVVFGLVLTPLRMPRWLNEVLAVPGTCFLRLLKMLVLPLITGSIMTGVVNLRRMGSGEDVKRVTRRAMSLYALTYFLAMVTGLFAVSLIEPGSVGQSSDVHKSSTWQCREAARGVPPAPAGDAGVSLGNATDQPGVVAAPSPVPAEKPTMVHRVTNVVYSAIPTNVFEALADSNILGVITFCIFVATALPVNSRDQPPTQAEVALQSFTDVIMVLINKVLVFTPVGVLSLILSKITAACDIYDMFATLGKFVATVLAALLVHGCVTLPTVYVVGTRGSGKGFPTFLKSFSRAFVTSLATSSSAATLPVSIQCAEQYGADKSIANFVLVLGSTVNMDGTAMYEAIAALFIAQRHNKDITLDYMIIVALTGSLAAMGAAAIPSAGLVTLLTVLQAADLSEFADDIALILVVDWLLDRIRTAVNVMGDTVAVCVVSQLYEADLKKNRTPGDVEMEGRATGEAHSLGRHGEFLYSPGHPVALRAAGGQVLSGGVVVERTLPAGETEHVYTVQHPTRGVFTGWRAAWLHVDPAGFTPRAEDAALLGTQAAGSSDAPPVDRAACSSTAEEGDAVVS